MKTKIILLLLSAFGFLFSTSFAQDIQLGNINLTFCNGGQITNELDLISQAGTEIPICINLINTSPDTTTINVDFLDATITQDEFKNRACNAADRPKEYFGNFMMDYNKLITISGNSTIQKTYNIKLPVGYKGLSHGCVAYNQIQTNKNTEKSMLNIIVRKVKFVDVFVGETQIKSQIKIGSIKTIKNGKTVNFQIGLKNIGNMDQNTTISGTISNMFGFKKSFKLSQNTISIPPNEEVQIQTNNEDLILPFYKGLFSIEFEITNKPVFNFNISADKNISQDIILGGNFKISKPIFISNPYFIGILVIFLVLIYLSFFKKRKNRLSKKLASNNK